MVTLDPIVAMTHSITLLQELATLFSNETYMQGDDQLVIKKLQEWTNEHSLTFEEVFLMVQTQRKVTKYTSLYAFLLEYGFGSLKNEQEAIEYYKIVAEQDSFALNQLGYHTENREEAFKYFSKSAEQGHPQGMSNVAYCFRIGTQHSSNFYKIYKAF